MKSISPQKRIIALVLFIVLMFGLAPSTATALELTALETESATDSSEVISLRDENIKHYNMGNGTLQAVAYSHPVHELDSKGNWQDIDFGLKLNETQSSDMYSNKAAGASFAANYTPSQPLMTLSSNDTSISMSLTTTSAGSVAHRSTTTAIAAKVTNPENNFRTIEDAKSATFSSKVLYEDVLPGVDLEYIVDPGTVKENIIVNNRTSHYEYVFMLDLSGLYPVIQSDGSIIVYNEDTDAQEYELPVPFMYDSLGNISEDVTYTLSESGNAYSLTVTANANWINAEDRSFPVTIDPTYVVSTTSVDDTYIDSDYPDTAHGARHRLWIRSNRVTYIKVPATSIPAYADLTWAALTAFYYYFDYVDSGSTGISAHKVTGGSWNENTLTWNSIANVSNYGLATTPLDTKEASGSVGATVDNPAQIDFVITSAVQSWLSGTSPDYGIGLKYVEGSSNLSVILRSYESSYDYRPRITYQYSVPYSTVCSVDLELIYDQAYDSRYSDAQARINREAEILKEFFLSEFCIQVNTSTPTSFASYADSNCSASYSAACTHADSNSCRNSSFANGQIALQDLHHKNIHNILLRIPSPSSTTSVKMAYTGHSTCAYGSAFDTCLDSPSNGLAYPDLHIMLITNPSGEASETLTMIHEMGHMFGIIDHYGQDCPSTDTMQDTDSEYSRYCIYGELKDNYSVDNITICQGCRNRVTENRDNYNS